MRLQTKPPSGPYLECFRKSWPVIFLENQNSHHEEGSESYVESQLNNCFSSSELSCPESILRDEPSRLQLFFRGDDDGPSSIEEEEITAFCAGIHPSTLKQPGGRQRRAAWLDDRSYSFYDPSRTQPSGRDQTISASEMPDAGNTNLNPTVTENGFSLGNPSTLHTDSPVRKYDAPLSAGALYYHLEEKRFKHGALPDADRRLIYISNLSPDYVYALTETAPPHQVPALKDALFKHLTSQTSMRVKISTSNYRLFQMEFHIPFYAVRRCPPKACFKDEVQTKIKRNWRDISFLAGGKLKEPSQRPLGIHQAHISFTICGASDSRWVAYAFADTDFDEDRDMSQYDFDYDSMVPDQIASDGWLNANTPVWNPREYFLLIVQIRMKQISNEWARLVRRLEKSIEEGIGVPPAFFTAAQSRSKVPEDAMDRFDWTQKVLQLISELLDELLKISEAWNRFSSPDRGDIGYFSELDALRVASQERMHGSLREILELFEDLGGLGQRLDILRQRCQTNAEILSLGLTLESNRVAKVGWITSETMIVWISPFLIVSVFFSIPEPFGSFHRSGASFACATIIVFAVLRLLILFEQWQIRPRFPWEYWIRPRSVWNKLSAMKGRRLLRSDTDSTLVGMKNARYADRAFHDAEKQGALDAMLMTSTTEFKEESYYEPHEPHLLRDAGNVDDVNWKEILTRLPKSWMWDVAYQMSYDCWTCTPIQRDGLNNLPLTIAGKPVVLPVEHRWPLIAGVCPPPDPHLAPIDCSAELPLDVIRDVLLTFEGSIGFYLLINGLLQIIVPEDFDIAWASSHLPQMYGGLKVCYIPQTMDPTVLSSKKDIAKTNTQPLHLNQVIEIRAKSSHRKERFAGRIGLKVTKNGDHYPYLAMSTHIITEAILAKSYITRIFRRNPARFRRLEDDWNKHVDIWAGNEKIGKVERTFDQNAEVYPNGFEHDTTLIKPDSPSAVKDIQSPIPNLGWLSGESWHSLRQRTSAVKILGDTCAAKTFRNSRPSEVLVVGEGIFLNQNSVSKPKNDYDISTWRNLVSRSVLYRVNPDFSPPNGYSGVALYADGTRQDGTEGPGVVGFQSFVQRSGPVQNFEMEGTALEMRLKLGRIAFYGAFQVPEELRKEYSVA